MKLPDGGSKNGFAREFTFTRDSRRLCTWEADFRILVWDVISGRLLAEHRPRPEGFPKDFDDDSPRGRRAFDEKFASDGPAYCFSADGSQLFWHFKKLRAYDTASGKLLRTFDEELDADYYLPRVSNDGELMLTGGVARRSRIFNLRQGKKQGQLPPAADTYSSASALAPDGRSFVVETAFHNQHRITLYETATLQPRLTIPLEHSRAHELNFSPDGRFLAIRLADRSALIWDLRAPGI